jgi:hypothetical protein
MIPEMIYGEHQIKVQCKELSLNSGG